MACLPILSNRIGSATGQLVKREPLETLIQEWLSRGDQIALLCALVMLRKSLVPASPLSASEVSQPLRLRRDALLREMNGMWGQSR